MDSVPVQPSSPGTGAPRVSLACPQQTAMNEPYAHVRAVSSYSEPRHRKKPIATPAHTHAQMQPVLFTSTQACKHPIRACREPVTVADPRKPASQPARTLLALSAACRSQLAPLTRLLPTAIPSASDVTFDGFRSTRSEPSSFRSKRSPFFHWLLVHGVRVRAHGVQVHGAVGLRVQIVAGRELTRHPINGAPPLPQAGQVYRYSRLRVSNPPPGPTRPCPLHARRRPAGAAAPWR
jgi:hypothetical protein